MAPDTGAHGRVGVFPSVHVEIDLAVREPENPGIAPLGRNTVLAGDRVGLDPCRKGDVTRQQKAGRVPAVDIVIVPVELLGGTDFPAGVGERVAGRGSVVPVGGRIAGVGFFHVVDGLVVLFPHGTVKRVGGRFGHGRAAPVGPGIAVGIHELGNLEPHVGIAVGVPFLDLVVQFKQFVGIGETQIVTFGRGEVGVIEPGQSLVKGYQYREIGQGGVGWRVPGERELHLPGVLHARVGHGGEDRAPVDVVIRNPDLELQVIRGPALCVEGELFDPARHVRRAKIGRARVAEPCRVGGRMRQIVSHVLAVVQDPAVVGVAAPGRRGPRIEILKRRAHFVARVKPAVVIVRVTVVDQPVVVRVDAGRRLVPLFEALNVHMAKLDVSHFDIRLGGEEPDGPSLHDSLRPAVVVKVAVTAANAVVQSFQVDVPVVVGHGDEADTVRIAREGSRELAGDVQPVRRLVRIVPPQGYLELRRERDVRHARLFQPVFVVVRFAPETREDGQVRPAGRLRRDGDFRVHGVVQPVRTVTAAVPGDRLVFEADAMPEGEMTESAQALHGVVDRPGIAPVHGGVESAGVVAAQLVDHDILAKGPTVGARHRPLRVADRFVRG